MTSLSIRARLTLWNGAILSAFVVALAMSAYELLRYTAVSQVDRALHEQAESIVHAIRAAKTFDPAAPEAAIGATLSSFREHDTAISIVDPNGTRVRAALALANDRPERERAPLLLDRTDSLRIDTALARHPARPASFSVPAQAGEVRVRVTRLNLDGRSYSVLVIQSLAGLNALFARVRIVALAAFPVALLLAVAGGHVIARRGLVPVADMSLQAARIGATNLHERLAPGNPDDELGRLATAFNALLDRVDRAFSDQRRFMADASHELRTPVAIIRGEADVALSSDHRSPEDYREALAIIRDGSLRLSHTVDDLFLLARADAGNAPLRVVPFYLDELIVECARSVRSLAKSSTFSVVVIPSDEVPYVGDEQLVARAIVNLIDNAIKHSCGKGTARLELRADDTWYRLTVSDTGPGIPPVAQPQIFDRFFRADVSRSRTAPLDGGGSGLGLSIARWIVETHGGRLELVTSSPAGTVFELALPLTPALADDGARARQASLPSV
jgi:heavy metal sensor kinase